MIFRFMNDQRQFHSVELMARVLEVSRKRVAHLMRTEELGARSKKKFRVTTKSAHRQVVAPNILDREFKVTQMNRAWVSDYTYIATAEGWLYLCVILDLANREVIGWSMSSYLGTETLLRAFWSAVRKCKPGEGLIFHSDRGVQYASSRFRRVLHSCRMVQSMSRKGDCWDNAPAESFFKTLKSELIGEYVYRTRAEAQQAIFEYIEVFYNRVRRHSYLGYLTPLEYKRQVA